MRAAAESTANSARRNAHPGLLLTIRQQPNRGRRQPPWAQAHVGL